MFDIKDRISFLAVHGSHAYGLNTPESDKDYRGFLIEPLEYSLSAFNNFEQTENHKVEVEGEDTTIFGLKKFFKLAADSNPNVIEILFVEDEEIIFKDKFAQKIINNRELFLSKKINLTFGGYAKAQLKRLENHRKWIVNPPITPPTREEFGLLNKRPVSEDTYKAAKSLIIVSELKDKLFIKLDESYAKSTLKRTPDREKIDNLYREIVLEKHFEK